MTRPAGLRARDAVPLGTLGAAEHEVRGACRISAPTRRLMTIRARPTQIRKLGNGSSQSGCHELPVCAAHCRAGVMHVHDDAQYNVQLASDTS